MRTRYLPWSQQRGAATLIVAIILLLALTLATFSAARIGVTEQRSVANDVRAKQAFWVAQAGVEQGIAFLNANKALISSQSALTLATAVSPPLEAGWAPRRRWDLCAGAGKKSISPPCGDGTTTHASGGISWARYTPFLPPLRQVSDDYSFNLDFLVPKFQPGNPPPINPAVIVTATVQRSGGDALRGLTGVGTDVLRVSQMIKGYDTLVGLPGANPPFIDAPLMVKGSVTLNANVNITLAATPGATLSIWSRGTTTLAGAGVGGGVVRQCVLHPLDMGSPSAGCAGIAVTANTVPPAFPPDLFYYVFGVANDSFQRVKNDATVLTDCSTLNAQPSGFYWVDGDCTIPAGANIGGTGAAGSGVTPPFTASAPITLVVNGGIFTLNAGVNFWGTVFLRGSELELPVVVPPALPPTLRGALISDGDLAVAGSLNLVYDAAAFSPGARAGGFAKVLGGWRDQAQ